MTVDEFIIAMRSVQGTWYLQAPHEWAPTGYLWCLIDGFPFEPIAAVAASLGLIALDRFSCGQGYNARPLLGLTMEDYQAIGHASDNDEHGCPRLRRKLLDAVGLGTHPLAGKGSLCKNTCLKSLWR
jgi:hypothetical protein